MKENEMDRTCNSHGRDEKCLPISVGKPERNRRRGRRRLS